MYDEENQIEEGPLQEEEIPWAIQRGVQMWIAFMELNVQEKFDRILKKLEREVECFQLFILHMLISSGDLHHILVAVDVVEKKLRDACYSVMNNFSFQGPFKDQCIQRIQNVIAIIDLNVEVVHNYFNRNSDWRNSRCL